MENSPPPSPPSCSPYRVKRGSSSKLGIDVYNSSNHDIRIPGRTLVGHVELVRSVIPAEAELKQDSESPVQQEGTSANTESDWVKTW